MKLQLILHILLSYNLVAAATMAADWPQFRGVGGQGVSADGNLPVSWSDSKNLLWKAKLPGHGASSPIAVDDRLFVSSYSGYGLDPQNPGSMDELRLHLTCFNLTGDQLWDREIQPKLPETERVRDHGYAAPTPASDGSFVYVFFGKSGLFKFDMNGQQIWQASVGEKTHGWGCGTSPVLFQDLVIVNASVESGDLVAIHQATGKEVWRAGGMDASWNTPHLVELESGAAELVVSVKGKVMGFEPSSGQLLWTCDGIPDYVCPSIVSHAGVVFIIGGRTSQAIAIRTGGRGDVTQTHRLWTAKAGANVVSPVIYAGHLYWVSDRNKVAYCLRLDDGQVMYAERFPDQPYASAIAGDGKLYIVTRNGGTYVLAAKPEFERLAHNSLDDSSTFNASPIVAHGKLFLRSNEFLYCVANTN